MAEENIQVVVRSRPLNARERKLGDVTIVSKTSEGHDILIRTSSKDAQAFRCNAVFTGNCSQDYFFNASGIVNLLDSAISGFRSCAFAYGQTGAGKTHTMVGSTLSINAHEESTGVLGRSLDYLFTKLESLNIEYAVRIACLELYQENMYDLLVDGKERVALPVREHPTDGFFVEGCQVVPCKNIAAAVKTVDRALRSRQVGSHDYNHRSNRSHFITEVFIDLPGQGAHMKGGSMEQAAGMTGLYDDMEEDREYTVMGRMTFVDLAGSERLKETNSHGRVLHETGSINKSLYVLGKVISGMARAQGNPNKREVPFRDSKLTKLLINSLGGASRTMMISCVSESSGALHETLRTLRFSMSAARIRNKPIRFLDPQEKLIMELREEIKRLRMENRQLRVGMDANSTPNRGGRESADSLRQPSETCHPPVAAMDSSPGSAVRKIKSEEHLKVAVSSSPTANGTPGSHFTTESYVPVMLQKRQERSKAKQHRVVSQQKKIAMPDKSYDIHGHLKDPAKVQARREAAAARKPTKMSSMKSHSSSVPIIYIKEGSGKPVTNKLKAANPYLAHIKRQKAPRRQPPPPSHSSSPSPYDRLPIIQSNEISRANKVQSLSHLRQRQSPLVEDHMLPSLSRAERSTQQHKHKIMADRPLYSQPQQPTRQDSPPASYSGDNLRTSVNMVKEKLVRMQAQLDARRGDITKNPSGATPEKWAKLEALEEEVRDMKLEVQISEQLQGLSKSMLMQNPSKVAMQQDHQKESKAEEKDGGELKQEFTSAVVAEAEDVVNIGHRSGSGDAEEGEDAYDDEYDDCDEFEEEEQEGITTVPVRNNSPPYGNMESAIVSKGSLSYSRTNSPTSPLRRQGSEDALPSLGSTLLGEKLVTSRSATPAVLEFLEDPPSARPESNDESERQANERDTDADDEGYGDEDFDDDEEYYGDDDFESTS